MMGAPFSSRAEPVEVDGTEAIQLAGFFATALLDQFGENLDEIDRIAAEILSDQLDAAVRVVRAKRVGDLCDRGRDFLGLMQQQLRTIHDANQTTIRQEIGEHIATARTGGATS